MNEPPATYNPYAAPAPPPTLGLPFAPRLAPPGLLDAVKWLYLAAAIVGLFPEALVALAPSLAPDLNPVVVGLAAILMLLALLAQLVLAIVWLVGAWRAVPFAERKGLSIGGAVGRLFLPGYGLYWMFQMPRRLIEGLESALARWGVSVHLRRDLPSIAAAAMLATSMGGATSWKEFVWVVAFVGKVFWVLFMREADRARRLLAATAPPRSPE